MFLDKFKLLVNFKKIIIIIILKTTLFSFQNLFLKIYVKE